MNLNSENWAIVKAALTAGLYPNVALQLNTENQICAHKFGPVIIDGDKSVVKSNSSGQWYIFDERSDNTIKGVTVVSPLTIFLFAGHNRLPTEYIVECAQGELLLYWL